jgi:hypothetical protein
MKHSARTDLDSLPAGSLLGILQSASVCPDSKSQRDSVLQPRIGAQRLPWVAVSYVFQPQRGGGQSVLSLDATPLGLVRKSNVRPKVARASQPWALRRNPVGILQSLIVKRAFKLSRASKSLNLRP